MLVFLAADLHVNTTARIQFLSLRFNYCYTLLQSQPDSFGYNERVKRCSNFTNLSPSDNNLFSFKIVPEGPGTRTLARWTVTGISYYPKWRLITLTLGAVTCLTSPKVNDKTPQTMQQLKGEVASSSAFILQLFTTYRFTSVCSRAKQGGEDPLMWACGSQIWSASITVYLLTLTICNIVAQAAHPPVTK